MELNNKTVVLTHATNTLGIALAKALDKEGSRLLLSSRDENALKQLSSELEARFHTYISGDINSEAGRVRLVYACQDGDTTIDILVNNPPQGAQGSFRAISQSAISTFINNNLTAPILLTRILLPQLVKRDAAQVVNIGTLSASIGLPGFAIDGAGRFGLRGFSEALAREFQNTSLSTIYVAHRGIDNSKAASSNLTPSLSKALKRPLDKPEAVAKAIIKAMKKDTTFYQVGWRERYWVKMNNLAPEMLSKKILKQLPTFAHFAREKTFRKP
jgi:short-subunit dehydrogenase